MSESTDNISETLWEFIQANPAIVDKARERARIVCFGRPFEGQAEGEIMLAYLAGIREILTRIPFTLENHPRTSACKDTCMYCYADGPAVFGCDGCEIYNCGFCISDRQKEAKTGRRSLIRIARQRPLHEK